MRTREQEYAAKIFGQVETLKPLPEKDRDEYGGMAHKLPVLVRTAGLAQALAFVEARGKSNHHTLLIHLAEVTIQKDKQTLLARSRGEAVGFESLGDYMRLTQQVLAALVWYKRFAESVLGVTSTDAAGLDPAQDDTPEQLENALAGGAP